PGRADVARPRQTHPRPGSERHRPRHRQPERTGGAEGAAIARSLNETADVLFAEEIMINQTAALRRLLADEAFIHMPVAYDALGGRLIEQTGFKAAYVGGFVTGGSRCTSEPLLTLDEQVRVAGDVAKAVGIPVLADAGAGFGEPLHTMRAVREFIHAGIAGVHIEDQLFPKRAHYHKYVAHVIPRKEFADKIRLACRQRDQTDKDFVIIARSDSCRF